VLPALGVRGRGGGRARAYEELSPAPAPALSAEVRVTDAGVYASGPPPKSYLQRLAVVSDAKLSKKEKKRLRLPPVGPSAARKPPAAFPKKPVLVQEPLVGLRKEDLQEEQHLSPKRLQSRGRSGSAGTPFAAPGAGLDSEDEEEDERGGFGSRAGYEGLEIAGNRAEELEREGAQLGMEPAGPMELHAEAAMERHESLIAELKPQIPELFQGEFIGDAEGARRAAERTAAEVIAKAVAKAGGAPTAAPASAAERQARIAGGRELLAEKLTLLRCLAERDPAAGKILAEIDAAPVGRFLSNEDVGLDIEALSSNAASAKALERIRAAVAFDTPSNANGEDGSKSAAASQESALLALAPSARAQMLETRESPATEEQLKMWKAVMFPALSPAVAKDVTQVTDWMHVTGGNVLKKALEPADVRGTEERTFLLLAVSFLELVRQVHVHCAERGSALLSVWRQLCGLFEHMLAGAERRLAQGLAEVQEAHAKDVSREEQAGMTNTRAMIMQEMYEQAVEAVQLIRGPGKWKVRLSAMENAKEHIAEVEAEARGKVETNAEKLWKANTDAVVWQARTAELEGKIKQLKLEIQEHSASRAAATRDKGTQSQEESASEILSSMGYTTDSLGSLGLMQEQIDELTEELNQEKARAAAAEMLLFELKDQSSGLDPGGRVEAALKRVAALEAALLKEQTQRKELEAEIEEERKSYLQKQRIFNKQTLVLGQEKAARSHAEGILLKLERDGHVPSGSSLSAQLELVKSTAPAGGNGGGALAQDTPNATSPVPSSSSQHAPLQRTQAVFTGV